MCMIKVMQKRGDFGGDVFRLSVFFPLMIVNLGIEDCSARMREMTFEHC